MTVIAAREWMVKQMATFDLDKMAKRLAEETLNEVIYEGKTLSEWIEIIKAHSVNAEPIVRCKECVCCSRWNDQLVCSRISGVMDGYYHGTVDVVKPDDYCSHGIRKTAKPIDLNKDLE